MAKVSVRYIVNDVDAAIDFYCQRLGFHEDMHPTPTFAMLSHGDLRLVLSAPGGGPGGGQAMPDGTKPEPGGWNRFQLEVVDIEATVAELRKHGADHHRSRWQTDTRRGPRWQPNRALRANHCRGEALTHRLNRAEGSDG